MSNPTDLVAQVAALTGAPAPAPVEKPDPDAWALTPEDALHLDEAEQANIAALIAEANPTPPEPQAPPAAEVPAPVVAAPPVPLLDAAKIAADKAALDAAFATQRTKFADGEITEAEFNRQLDAYTGQVAPLLTAQQEAARQQKAFEDTWDQNVGTFMTQRSFVSSPAHVAIFDKHLIEVGTAHPQMDQAARMEWAYGKMVADAVSAGLPIPRVSAAAPQVGIAPTPSAAPAPRDPAQNQGLGAIPPTVATMPNSMDSGASTGQFAHLSALINSRNIEGYTKAEQAMASMSEEQLESFLMHG